MDGWEAMALPRTAASYYMQQRGGVSVLGLGTQLDSSLPISAHGVNASAGLPQEEPNASAGLSQEELNAPEGLSQGEPVSRKRGRPRKNELDGGELNASAGLPQGEPVRRKRGRPRKNGPDGGTVSLGIPSQNLPVQSNLGGNSAGSAFQPDSSSPISADGVNASAQGEPVKRRRPGRPRRYGPDGRRRPGRPRKKGPYGTVSLGLSKQNVSVQSNLRGDSAGSAFQLDSSSPISAHGVNASARLSQGEPVRRRRPGRPRKKGLSSVSSPPPPPPHGEWLSGSAGMGLTPHVITIAVGEDIAEKVMSFSQQGPRAVCILSANGTVSTVTLRRPSTSSGTVKYEGCFEILWLSGSYMTDIDGSRSRTGGMSVCLCSQNGEVIYGGVGEMLVAATLVQVIVGSFMYSGSKTEHAVVTISESSVASESSVDSGDKSVTPTEHPSGDKSVPSTSIPTSNQNRWG